MRWDRFKKTAVLGIALLLGEVPREAHPSVTVTVDGSSHTIPQTNERGWGANVTAWIQAISSGTLQHTGGTFTLTADANFGATYGLFSNYFSSRSSNISTTGVLRLSNTDGIGWRNSGASGNYLLKPDADGVLQYNSVDIPTISSSATLTNKLLSDSTTYFVNVSDATKIAKFSLGGATAGKTATLAVPVTLDRTITFPDATDTLAGKATTDTFTNKTMSGASNTFTNISLTSAVTGVLPIANGGTNNSTAYTSGSIPFSNGTSLTQDNSNLFWDATNHIVMVEGTAGTGGQLFVNKTSSPVTNIPLHVKRITAAGSSAARFESSTSDVNIGFINTGADNTHNALVGATGETFFIKTSSSSITALSVDNAQNVNLPQLTASLPLQLDASKNIVSTPITLSGSQVTGTLPIANGGTNNSSAYTTGSLPYSNGTSLTQDNSNLFWDGSNHRLGIGTTSPSLPLQVKRTGAVGAAKFESNQSNVFVSFADSGTTNNSVIGSSGDSFIVGTGGASTTKVQVGTSAITLSEPTTITNATTSGTPASASQINSGDPNTKSLIIAGNTTYSVASAQPDSISGLYLWLKADSLSLSDGDVVTTWTDSSSNAYSATQGTANKKPIFRTNVAGGYPAVLFDGVNDDLRNTTMTGLGVSNFTEFVVVNSLTTGAHIAFFMANNGGSAGASFALKQANGSGEGVFADWGSGTSLDMTAPLLGLSAFGVWEGKQIHSTNTFSGYVNGTASTPATADSTSLNISEAGYWLGSDRASGQYWNGYIAEVIVYNSALSDANRKAVESYLEAKYNFAGATVTNQVSNIGEWQNAGSGVLGSMNSSGTLTALNFKKSGTTAGSVLFVKSDYTFTENNSSLFWDDTNSKFGVGTNSPMVKLHVKSTSSETGEIESTQNNARLSFVDSGTTNRIFVGSSGDSFSVLTGAGSTEKLAVSTAGVVTISQLTASLPVQTNGSSALVSAAIDLSGSQATGTIAAARMPALTGDITTSAGAVATTLATTIGNPHTLSGTITLSGLSASLPLQTDASKNIVSTAIDLSGTQATGTIAAARMPALTGEITTSAGAVATTLATSIANAHTFSGALTLSGGIVGTTAGGDATAGNVGEYIECVNTAFTNYGTTATNFVMTKDGGGNCSIVLSAGDWDVDMTTHWLQNGAVSVLSGSNPYVFIGTATGDNTTGKVTARNTCLTTIPTGTINTTTSCRTPTYRVVSAGSTTLYAKGYAEFTTAIPQYMVLLSARRVR